MSQIYLAPMVGWSTSLFRRMIQAFNSDCIVFTEMLSVQSLIYGKQFAKLSVHPDEHHVICQLAGSNPQHFLDCAGFKERFSGFNEINLNVGCPSQKVQKANMGACLMLQPERVRDCLEAMKSLGLDVSIKCRIGVDDQSLDDFIHFISICQKTCRKFYVHARYALLNGINPKKNRSVPPIRYDIVRHVAKLFPNCEFVINGELNTPETVNEMMLDSGLSGVMIGRSAYQNPWLFYKMSAEKKIQCHKLLSFADGIFLTTQRDLEWCRVISSLTKGVHGGKAIRRLFAMDRECDLTHIKEEVLSSLRTRACQMQNQVAETY